jgi:octaprenyl-diphosphate synthase
VASATNTVCSGEILQTRHRRNFELSRRDYFRVLEMKTAELFALSCELAAFLSEATPAQRAALREFGLAFGTAYQIYDDCVDLFGTEKAAGKSLGTDLAKGKLTYPVLLAWERANAADRTRLETLVKDWQPGSFARVTELLVRHETLQPSRELIERYLAQARQSLRSLPESGGRAGLAGVTDYLARQTAALSE